MKRIVISLVFCCFIATFVSMSYGAEYLVRSGDNLNKIAKTTGYTINQLVLMNKIENRDRIYINQKITFVSNNDKLRAKVWAEKRRTKLNPSDKNYEYFGWVLEDIRNNHLRFSINEHSGTYFSSILWFAKAQGKVCRVQWKSNKTSAKGHGEWISEEYATAGIKAQEHNNDIYHWLECK